MRRKKGEIELQFNWIFVLIAGALIFVFFFGIIKWFTDSSSKSASISISNYLDSLFTALTTPKTKSTVSTFVTSFDKLEFICQVEQDAVINQYKVDRSNWQDLGNRIIFAPNRIENGKLVLWSLAWSAPYRIENFLFVSSPEVRYIFITDNSDNKIFEFLRNEFPRSVKETKNKVEKQFLAEFYSGPSPVLKDLHNYKVRFVYINVVPNDNDLNVFRNMMEADVTAVKISGDNFDSLVSVDFYGMNKAGLVWTNRGNTRAFKEPQLLGAIFSENKNEYDCQMRKAYKKLELVSKIYESRLGMMISHFQSSDTFCANSYVNPKNKINDLINELSNPYRPGYYSKLKEVSDSIGLDNVNLEKNSCEVIY